MGVVTIPKKEYESLLDVKLRYEYLRRLMAEDIFSPPPARNVIEVIKAFRGAKKYNSRFLRALERGLRRSSYFTS